MPRKWPGTASAVAFADGRPAPLRGPHGRRIVRCESRAAHDHGCTQTAEAYENAGWNQLADEWGFYVVYPGQNTAKNNGSGCFNWGGRWKSAPQAFVFSPEPLTDDDTENQSIRQMVDKMKADHAIDTSRIFVTGLSAGGAMTALLLAKNPDMAVRRTRRRRAKPRRA